MTPAPQTNPATDPLAALGASLTPKRAVSYVRVSTREQAERGGHEEGFSIPAQRDANRRKATSIGALVVKEFVDRGESARSANRPELQRMLRYLKDTPDIDYVIVHKLDRLARNRADDVEINQAFDQAGVRLVSTSENIDQTPGGILLHGIMSSIAEFYSRNLAGEVIKGMGEKARNGGTIGKAPLGYLNVRDRDDKGREIRTVHLDPQRAPLLKLAFTEYATGQWTLRQLAEHLNNLGLTIPATPTKPEKPVSANHLHRLLRHPYYKGVVTFQGVAYAGSHEPLTDEQTWHQVQQILASHRNGERERTHRHYLRTTIVCGLCGARLLVQNAKNRAGVVYPYFVCARRHRLHTCEFRAVLIEQVETRVTELYQRIHLTPQDRDAVERHVTAELERSEAESQHEVRSLTTRRTNLEDERRHLMHAHYAGAVPLDLLKSEQDRISGELGTIHRRLDVLQADASQARATLSQALDLLQDCHRMYLSAPDHLKKLLNQVFFERVLVNPTTDADGRLKIPAHALTTLPDEDTANHTGHTDHSDHTHDQHALREAGTTDQTRAAATLTPLMAQLSDPSLIATARLTRHQSAPTLTGRRASASDQSPHAASLSREGSYSDLMVRRAGIEPARLVGIRF